MRTQTDRRLELVLRTIEPGARAAGAEAVTARLLPHLDARADDVLWLTLAVLQGEYPTADAVVALRRRVRLDGPAGALRALTARSAVTRTVRGRTGAVRVVREATVVDLHHTAGTGLATGIQRVARETVRAWAREHPVVLARWGKGHDGLHALGPDGVQRALTGSGAEQRTQTPEPLLVPWRSRLLLPELAIEPRRTQRLAAFAEFSGNATAAIGFDCVPLTTAETVAPGMASAFARNLVALSRFDLVATISEAAATEYRGWRRMLTGAGLQGPEIEAVSLPATRPEVDPGQLAVARDTLGIGDLPLVLCVGSHEPRKNHLAVLQAAELLWRSGREFALAFIGGNAWRDEDFVQRVAELQDAGRPVTTARAVSDDVLHAAYRIAECSVFPSLNEGFGLPVAESLASGTPVVTSRFGSMEEIAASGGAVLVDPRQDGEIAAAIDRVLFDPETRARLQVELSGFSPGQWSEYAAALWETFSRAPRSRATGPGKNNPGKEHGDQ
jgi:glycosyltransferase involved in cell wall biosynthesis